MTIPRDAEAPHGRDADGVPLAPFGLRKDGKPRISRRGAGPGERGNRDSRREPKSGLSPTDKARKKMLSDLISDVIVMPLIAFSASPLAEKFVGDRQAMALAGDGLIIAAHADPLAEGLVVLGQSRPGLLSWLDRMEEKAPYLLLVSVGVKIAKAFIGNHLAPSESMARAAVNIVNARAVELARQFADVEMDISPEGVSDAAP